MTMKTITFFCIIIFLICFVFVETSAQDISVQNLIGKSKSEVIKKFGKPVHQDNSNPAMICMFYQDKTTRMIFVSNKDGVYQSEATVTYSTETLARKAVDKFIINSVADGFDVDTVTTNDFEVHKKGIRTDLQLSENKITKKYVVSVKARSSED
jgi:hypothetical protein